MTDHDDDGDGEDEERVRYMKTIIHTIISR